MREIQTSPKITRLIPSPLVYEISSTGLTEEEFLQALKMVSKTMRGSWAYSNDHITTKCDRNYNLETTTRRYFAFESELDAMQFALTFETAKRVYMWPSNLYFTAHLFRNSETINQDQGQTK